MAPRRVPAVLALVALLLPGGPALGAVAPALGAPLPPPASDAVCDAWGGPLPVAECKQPAWRDAFGGPGDERARRVAATPDGRLALVVVTRAETAAIELRAVDSATGAPAWSAVQYGYDPQLVADGPWIDLAYTAPDPVAGDHFVASAKRFAEDGSVAWQVFLDRSDSPSTDLTSVDGLGASPDGRRLFVGIEAYRDIVRLGVVALDASTGAAEWTAFNPGSQHQGWGVLAVSPDGGAVFRAGKEGYFSTHTPLVVAAFAARDGALRWSSALAIAGRDSAPEGMAASAGVVAVTGFASDDATNPSAASSVLTAGFNATTGAEWWRQVSSHALWSGTEAGHALALSPGMDTAYVAAVALADVLPDGAVVKPYPSFAVLAYAMADGSPAWRALYGGGLPGGYSAAFAVAVAGDGRVVAAGNSLGLAGGAETITLGYDASGAKLWGAREENHGTLQNSQPGGVAVAPDGARAYVAGWRHPDSNPFGIGDDYDGFSLAYAT